MCDCIWYNGISQSRLKEFLELHTSLTSEAVLRFPRFGHRKYNINIDFEHFYLIDEFTNCAIIKGQQQENICIEKVT